MCRQNSWRTTGPYVDMHFEMHMTAFRGLLDAALCTKKQEKTIRSAERDAPSDQEGRQHPRGAARDESRRDARADSWRLRAKQIDDLLTSTTGASKAICDFKRLDARPGLQ